MPLNKKRYNRQKVNKRILAIHSAIADKLIRHPDLISKVWHCLEKRTEQNLLRYRDKLVWQDLLPLLDQDPELFKQELLATDEKMETLRRETIFVGILTEEERQSVLDAYSSSTEKVAD
jgi:hypothetical protein